MRKRRHKEIAIEVDQVITITRRPTAVCDWCSRCESKVVMVTLDEASSVISIGTLALVRMIEGHQLHFTENNAGLIRLCLPSLVERMATARSTNNDKGDTGSEYESIDESLFR